MKTIYVATWGNPLEWQEVEYQCDEGRGKRRGFASIVCAEADRYVIHVLDSVIAAAVGRGQDRRANPHAVEAAKAAGLKVSEGGGGSTVEPPSCEGWRQYAERYVQELARRASVEASAIVTAASGRLGGRYYRGHPDLILAELIWGLWREVEKLGEPGGQLRIHLDVTHGVNFMPTVALWAVRLIASIALAAGYEKVVLKAYNATPGEWHYVKIFEENITYIQFPRLPKSLAARALYYGAPVHYAHLCRESLEPSPPAEGPMCKDAEIYYQQNYVEPLDLYEKLLAAAGCPKKTPTLMQLRDWHIVKVLTPTARRVVEHELSEIYDKLRTVKIGRCSKLNELLPYAVSEDKPCVDDNRNFVAHAGLLAGQTTVCPHGDDYQIMVDLEATRRCLEK